MKYLIGTLLIEIPDDHLLPVYQGLEPNYDRLPYFYLSSLLKCYPDHHTIIDIGANIGDTAAILRSYSSKPIVCFEGNETFSSALKRNKNKIGNLTIKEKFVIGDTETDYSYSGGSTTGGFSISNNQLTLQEKDKTIEHPSKVIEDNSPIALIKSDTDGFDGLMLKWFKAYGNYLYFIECDASIEKEIHGKTIIDIELLNLIEKGYELIVFDNHGWPLTFVNQENSNLLAQLFDFVESPDNISANHRVYYYDIIAVPPELVSISQHVKNEIEEAYSSILAYGPKALKNRSNLVYKIKNNYISKIV